MKDWRGTEIEVGSKVITHSKNWNHGLGVVAKINHKTTSVTVALREQDIARDKQTLVTYASSVTVLTKDMFDDN